jgi:hypothetical protein
MTVPGEMSLYVLQKTTAWGAYFNAWQGAATNGVTSIFGKTCRNFVWARKLLLCAVAIGLIWQ